MKHYIYGLYKKNIEYKTNTIDENLFYIGISSGSKNLYFRSKNHRREKSNPYKLNIINKYDFVLKILWVTDTRKEAEERESFLIRWFRNILTNHLESSDDTKYARKHRTKNTNIKISIALKKIYQNDFYITKNRDSQLSIPYDTIISYIEEWSKNPLQSQTDFAKKINISRSKFKDWIRLYKPEYIGLKKKFLKQIFLEIYNENDKNCILIKKFAKMSGLSESQSKSIVYRLLKER